MIGGIYAAFAIGFSLIFGVLRIINIAHGEFIMLGAFTTYWFYKLYGIDPFISLPISFVLLFIFGYFLERFIIHRVTKAQELMSLLLTFGLSLIISNIALLIWKGDYRSVTTSYAGANIKLDGFIIPYMRFFTFLFAIATVIGLFIFLQKTDTGRAIRATAQNREGAQLLGVSPLRIYAIAFGLGAAVTGVTGSLLSTMFSIFPTMGVEYLLFSFCIVVVGGLGYIPGALAGGLLLGIIQSFSTNFLGAGVTYVILFLILYAMLVIRPTGIFGKGITG